MAVTSGTRALRVAAALAAVASAADCAWGSADCPAQASRLPAETMEAALLDSRQEQPAQLLQVKAAPRRLQPVQHQHQPEEETAASNQSADALNPTPGVNVTQWLIDHTTPAPPQTVQFTTQSAALKKTLPVSWLHIPKCGTSFMNALVHLPGVCPSVPDNVTICFEEFPQDTWKFSNVFKEKYDVPGSCPGIVDMGEGHDGIKYRPGYNASKGNYMTMLRDPEQRTMSTWWDLQFCLKHEPFDALVPVYRSWGGFKDGKAPTTNFTEWAISYQGCAVKMLTREGYRCGDQVHPTWDEVEEAKERLHTDVSFVGMTDQWALSMCLLSAQFKVRCLPSMMVDNRKGRIDDTVMWNVSRLSGIEDPYDGALFKEGTKIFQDNLRKYNVTEEWCNRTCYKDAGIL